MSTELLSLKGVGPKTLAALNRAGIRSLVDLVSLVPTRYLDYRHPVELDQLTPDQDYQLVRARIHRVSLARIRGGRSLINLTIAPASVDSPTPTYQLQIWNQPYLIKQFIVDELRLLACQLKLDPSLPAGFRLTNPRLVKQSEILPLYPRIYGLRSSLIRQLITQALSQLPISARSLHPQLMSDQELWQTVHFPEGLTRLEQAKQSLALNELIAIRLVLSEQSRNLLGYQLDRLRDSVIVPQLPFKLTSDQQTVVKEIQTELTLPLALRRLLQGDVGTGKTIVATLVAEQLILAGQTVAWLAPTTILAKQHQQTLARLAPDLPTSLMTGQVSRATKAQNQFKNGGLIIGTQALLYRQKQLPDFALIIIDEQHRFGVEQRAKLLQPNHLGLVPHLLTMTATPIPRTLALTLFDSLKLSTLKTGPKHRQPIKTKALGKKQRSLAWQLIQRSLNQGERVYLVAPWIDPFKGEAAEGDQEIDNLRDLQLEAIQELSDQAKISLTHGRLTEAEKQAALESFRSGQSNLLLATSLIEVGIDVPEATLMVIFSAESFGLATLHQLRGRVGRGTLASHCLLLTNSDSPLVRQRLMALETLTDGQAIAELDLSLRGAGQLAGREQSGIVSLRFANWQDTDQLLLAKKISQEIDYLDLASTDWLKQLIDQQLTQHFE